MIRNTLFGALTTLLFFGLLEITALTVEALVPPPGTVGDLRVPPREPEEYRIFVFGGSTAYGEPLPEFGFAPQLEHQLRRANPGTNLKLFNFGRPNLASLDVRRRVRDALPLEPDLLIVLTGHNEFLNREGSSAWVEFIDGFATIRVIAREWRRLRLAVFGIPRSVFMPVHMEPYERDEPLFREKVERYRANTGSIAAAARDAAIPLLFVTAPSNEADWPPVFLSFESKERQSQYRELDALLEKSGGRRGGEALDRLNETRAQDYLWIYLRAREARLRGENAKAAQLYGQARDLDPLPWRALSGFNAHLRTLKNEAGVFVADPAADFKGFAPDGLVGFELIADNCHPTPLGGALIARSILERIAANGWLNVELGENAGEDLEAYLSEAFDAPRRRTLELEYLLANGKYAMKTPFYNFKASRMYLERARGLEETNWVVWANLATLAFFEGKKEEGNRQLKRAIQLNGKNLDLNDRRNTPYLKEALRRALSR